jgi:transposase
MNFTLTAEDTETLRGYQRNVFGTKEYVKVTCILMLSRQFSPQVVSESLGIDVSTVYRYRNIYLRSGLEDFMEDRHQGYRGLLSSRELSILRMELKRNLYVDAKSVGIWIQNTFGVVYPTGSC